MLFKFLILQKHGHHGHHDCGTVIGSCVQTVALYHLGISVKAAGGDVTGCTVKDDEMVCIRSFGRLIFCNHPVVDNADGTFTVSGHAVDNGMNSLDNRTAQRCFRAGPILG